MHGGVRGVLECFSRCVQGVLKEFPLVQAPSEHCGKAAEALEVQYARGKSR